MRNFKSKNCLVITEKRSLSADTFDEIMLAPKPARVDDWFLAFSKTLIKYAIYSLMMVFLLL